MKKSQLLREIIAKKMLEKYKEKQKAPVDAKIAKAWEEYYCK